MSPTLWFGDLIVITPPKASIPAGTIITMSVDGSLVTHRLTTMYQGGLPETKGDANEINDNFSNNNVKIVGIVRLNIPLIGYPFICLQDFINNVLL